MDGKTKLLVVDGSRVVRATLSKRLTALYSIIEESDGESAWQTLMLDTSICAVISGAQPPRLEACDLLARMRASTKRHLRSLPVVLIVSDIEHYEHRERDLNAGVAAFITKTMDTGAIRDILECVIAGPHANSPASRVLDQTTFTNRLANVAPQEAASLLVFSIDARAELEKRFGAQSLARIDAHLADLIASRLSRDDVLGQAALGQLALLAPGVSAADGSRFARQIGKSLKKGQITVRNETITLTLSAGLAHSLSDRENNPHKLLSLARARAVQACQQGGNMVIDPPDESALADWSTVSSWLTSDLDRASLIRLAPELYPFLVTIDRELKLNLPLANINQRLQQLAQGK